MAQMPNLQAPDVFGPISKAGQATGEAMGNIGKRIDTYNTMNRALQDKRGRRVIRDKMVKEAGLSENDLPRDMTQDEIRDFGTKVQYIRKLLKDVGEQKSATPKEQRLVLLAAQAISVQDDTQFWKLAEAIEEASEAKKTKGDQAAQGELLQEVGAGLRTGPAESIEMKADMPDVAQPGTVEPSPAQEAYIAGTGGREGAMSQHEPDEVTMEGAIRAAQEAGIKWENTTPEQREMFIKQFRSEKDIGAEKARAETAGARGRPKPTKPIEIKRYLRGIKSDIGDLHKEIDRLLAAQAKLKAGESVDAIDAAILQEAGSTETDPVEVVKENLYNAVTTKKKAINDYIKDYNQDAPSVGKKDLIPWKLAGPYQPEAPSAEPGAGPTPAPSGGRYAPPAKGPAPAVAPAPSAKPAVAAGPVAKALRQQYETSAIAKRLGISFDEFKTKYPREYAKALAAMKRK